VLITEKFTGLDDDDLFVSAKAWTKHPDQILAYLSKCLLNRNLPKVKIQDSPFDESYIEQLKIKVQEFFRIRSGEADYLVHSGTISNHAYSGLDDKIRILYNNGDIKDITESSDIFNVSLLTRPSIKYFLCYPKECGV
jgi:hypothetical protein